MLLDNVGPPIVPSENVTMIPLESSLSTWMICISPVVMKKVSPLYLQSAYHITLGMARLSNLAHN